VQSRRDPRHLGQTPGRKQSRNDGASIGIRYDEGSALERQPTDGDQGDACYSATPSGLRQRGQANHRFRIGFGRGPEDRAKCHVRWAREQGPVDLIQSMSGDANGEARGQPSGVLEAQIGLPEVHAMAPRQQGQVRTIIGKNGDVEGLAPALYRP
jgi:hypothetical protein